MRVLLTKEQLATEFVTLFPRHRVDYEEHMAAYSELLGHVFFGDVIDGPLATLLKENKDKESICRYVSFVERMYAFGDDDVRNVVEVTILEYLGDDELVLQNAFSYFSRELIDASSQVEEMLGRRKIIISSKKGKISTRWEPYPR